jgi:hypothetical protein
MAFSLQTNYTDWGTATGRQILVPTFVDKTVSRGQLSRTPTAVNLSFLDRNVIDICRIWGFHGSNYEEWRLLGCYAMWLL